MNKKMHIPIILAIVGGIFSFILFPIEQQRVISHLKGFPDENFIAHILRPYLISLLFFVPCILAFINSLSGILDRYLMSQFTRCFLICFFAMSALFVLMELQNRASEFSDFSLVEVLTYYLIQAPQMLMMIIPYSLLLSLLWCLGKLSKSKEIVSVIQGGRSIMRLIRPFILVGLFLSLIMFILSYHWAPYSEAYKRALNNTFQKENNYVATNVGYGDPESGRVWTVGSFPKNFSNGEPLKNITITQTNQEHQITERFLSKLAVWQGDTRTWELTDIIHIDFTPTLKSTVSPSDKVNHHKVTFPKITKKQTLTLDLPETPWQIIRPALKPNQLGIPELTSWISNNPDHPLSFKRAYSTWWHFRFAQPFICIIIVLLSIPLGISFSRSSSGGGITIAILLSAIMLFCSEVFPTLGESGHLPPILAAWATNILFGFVAIFLFHRRLSGKPIFQKIKDWVSK